MGSSIVEKLTPLEVRRGLRASILHGFFATVFASTTGGLFLIGYALKLQATNLQIGVLSALGPAMSPVQLLAAYIIERYRQRKLLCLVTSAAGVAVWIPIVLLPFFIPPEARALRLYLLSGLIALSCFAFALSSNSWLAWISALVPKDERGRFLARRNVIAGLAGAAFVVLEGSFLDFVKELHGFTAIFTFGLVFGFVGILFLARQPDPPMLHREETVRFADQLHTALNYRPLRALIVFFVGWAFAAMIAAPFYTVYMIKELGLRYVEISLFNVAATVSSMVAMPFWGKLIDRYCSKPVLFICTAIAGILPFLWLASSKENALWLIPMITTIGGVAGAGIGLSANTMLLTVCPEDAKSVYLAIFGSITGLLGALAPVIGGMVSEAAGSFKLLFAMSGTIILAFLPVIFLIKEPNEISMLEFLRRSAGRRLRDTLGKKTL